MLKNEGLEQLVREFINFYPHKFHHYDGIYEDFLYFLYQVFTNKINTIKNKKDKTKYNKTRSEILRYVLNNKNELLTYIHKYQNKIKR